jgi:hypothetical protein
VLNSNVIQPGWSSPFVSFVDPSDEHSLIVTRGKNNKLLVVDPETLDYISVKETGGYSVFCTYPLDNLLVTGCYNGNLYIFDSSNDFKTTLSKSIT